MRRSTPEDWANIMAEMPRLCTGKNRNALSMMFSISPDKAYELAEILVSQGKLFSVVANNRRLGRLFFGSKADADEFQAQEKKDAGPGSVAAVRAKKGKEYAYKGSMTWGPEWNTRAIDPNFTGHYIQEWRKLRGI